MNLLTADADEVEVLKVDQVAPVLAGTPHDRRTAARYWLKRHQHTSRWPGSVQHQVACAVLDALSPKAVAAAMCALGAEPVDTDAA